MSKDKPEVVETAPEATGASVTDLFKVHLQKIIKDRLGARVSKKDSWDLFKDIIHGTVEFVVNQPLEGVDDGESLGTRRLPLAGVGSFEVLNTKPRNTKAGLVKKDDGEWVRDESLPVWEFVPRFRFYPSSKVSEFLEQHFGLADHGLTPVSYGIFASPAEEAAEEVAEEVPAETPAKTAKKSKSKAKAAAADIL